VPAHLDGEKRLVIMAENEYTEKVTIGEQDIIIRRFANPVKHKAIEAGAELLRVLNILNPALRPSNYQKADGTPMRLFDSENLRIDLSKRSAEDMSFWHRNIDYNEIIFCFQGALRWETELGTVTLHPGEMLYIPRGIAHRSTLCEESADENILIELKTKDDLNLAVDPDEDGAAGV
jgi:hypothetical protein